MGWITQVIHVFGSELLGVLNEKGVVEAASFCLDWLIIGHMTSKPNHLPSDHRTHNSGHAKTLTRLNGVDAKTLHRRELRQGEINWHIGLRPCSRQPLLISTSRKVDSASFVPQN